jgi:hypothetical protein
MEEDERGGACSTKNMRNAYIILVGKPEGKRRLGRSRRIWEEIRTDFRERGRGRCGLDSSV